MTFLSLVLEIHQPVRLSKAFPQERLKRIAEGASITDRYFDRTLNEEVFRKVAKKCYYPTFSTLEDLLRLGKDESTPFKVALGLSGPFLEQAIRYEPKLLEMLKGLLKTGNVEILGGTYYHSLASLFPDAKKIEFVEQVKQHISFVKSTLNYEPRIFENTEFLYNDTIAKHVEALGFTGILSEGSESSLGWRSPNYVYSPLGGTGLKLLLRHYKLTDDIGFRFSQKSWAEYPLMADKYASWLSATPGEYILLAMDIETFGEHHWEDTGIFQFLRELPRQIAAKTNLRWATPSDIVAAVPASGVIGVPEKETISWADVEKDATAWLQNPMQRISFERLTALEPYVRELERKEVTDVWRLLQQSDHLYYMSTKGGGPGEVHTYFSPYDSPAEAFAIFDSVITDYEGRIGSLVDELRNKKAAASSASSSSSKHLKEPQISRRQGAQPKTQKI